MKINQFICAIAVLAFTGCYSNESKSGGPNSSPQESNATNAEENISGIPEEIRNLRFAVIQHTGDVTDWRITMQDFATGFKKWAHPDSKFVWDRDGKDSWILRMSRLDKTSQSETKLVFVFKKSGNKAVLSRYILGNDEAPLSHLAVATNDIVYNILHAIDKVDDSKRLPASE